MKTNARIVTGAAILAASTTALGRSAVQWRDGFYQTQFAAGRDLAEQTKNKKSPQPRFEVHEREIGHRTFSATLMQRANNGKLTEVSRIVVGMFGKLIEAPAATDTAQAA